MYESSHAYTHKSWHHSPGSFDLLVRVVGLRVLLRPERVVLIVLSQHVLPQERTEDSNRQILEDDRKQEPAEDHDYQPRLVVLLRNKLVIPK